MVFSPKKLLLLAVPEAPFNCPTKKDLSTAEARQKVKPGYNGFLSKLLLLAKIQEVGIVHASDLMLLNPGQHLHPQRHL